MSPPLVVILPAQSDISSPGFNITATCKAVLCTSEVELNLCITLDLSKEVNTVGAAAVLLYTPNANISPPLFADDIDIVQAI